MTITAELVRGKRYQLVRRHHGKDDLIFLPGQPLEVTPDERDHLAKAVDVKTFQDYKGLTEIQEYPKFTFVEIDISRKN